MKVTDSCRNQWGRSVTDFTDRPHYPFEVLRQLMDRVIADAPGALSPRVATSGRVADDVDLVYALRDGLPGAQAQFFDRYGEYVERLLIRVLGSDPEVEDLLHEVFLQSFACVHKLRDPGALKPWLTRLTVNVARSCIRKRSRSRWLVFLPHERVPEVAEDGSEARALMTRVYRALSGIRSAEDRIAFALRYLDGMTLPEVARASGCSLATAKRRVTRGKTAFLKTARRDPELVERFDLGGAA
ncbi:MAG: sigma-70 family RNA polymerase sigma factor [Myxococcota bacterium]